MKICKKCHNVIPKDADVCPNCGSSEYVKAPSASDVTNLCPKCGKEVPEHSQFCPHCGFRLASLEPNIPVRPVNANKPSNTRKNQSPPVLLILFIALVLCGGSIVLNSCSPTPTSKNTNTTSTAKSTSTPKKEVQKVPLPASLKAVEVNNNSIGEPTLTVVLSNDTDKTIDAFKVCVEASNNYGDPVKGYGSDPFYFGLSQDTIAPGTQSSSNQYWTLHGFDNGTTFKVQLWSVHFTDGTKWEAKQSDKEEVTVKKTNKVIR